VIDQDDDGRRVRPWATRLDELRPARRHLTAGAPGHPSVLLSRLDEASHDGARQGGVAATVVANVDDEATGRAQSVEGSVEALDEIRLREAAYGDVPAIVVEQPEGERLVVVCRRGGGNRD
jgi:hypothetical protein